MRPSFALAAAALVCIAEAQNTQTSTIAVEAAAATARVSSPTSKIKGKAFQRFVNIWFENTNYALASTDPNFAYLAKKGITLSNFYGTTHPSQPNYISAIAGDNFGLDNDDFQQIPTDIYTLIDLLEDKGISWGTYQEGMPYAGYEGYSWINGTTGANDYVRKHHPTVIFEINDTPTRLSQQKNFTSFYDDLANEKLPQWMFITPNMLNDAHDTSVTYAGEWFIGFMEELLANEYFMKDTLILVTFDETETYTLKNNVFSFLLGDAVPSEDVDTTDSSFYNHFSEIATVEANWDLHTLGRWDVGANVFHVVGKQTGDVIRQWKRTNFTNVYLNDTFAGPLNDDNSSVPWPTPNLEITRNGRTVLPAVKTAWKKAAAKTWYENMIEVYWGQDPPPGYNAAYYS